MSPPPWRALQAAAQDNKDARWDEVWRLHRDGGADALAVHGAEEAS